MAGPALCDFASGYWLIFGPNVGPLQYYSHLPVIIISLILGFYILLQNWKSLANQALFGSIVAFVLWVFFDSIIWATNRSDIIMFMWSLQVLIEPLVYMGCLMLLYALVDKKPPPFNTLLVWTIIYLPLVAIVPTKYVLSSFDLYICLANETYIAYYSYVVEIFFVLWITHFATTRYGKASATEKKEIVVLVVGVILLLLSFAWGNIIGSFTEDWQLGQYGLFGMPIFTALLVYSIVQYGTFSTQLLGAIALVVGLWGLNLSLLFVQKAEVFRGVVIATLVVAVGFGIMLIQSIVREIRQRRLIEKQEKELEVANKQQESLLHFISHEVKGYLTKSQAAFAAIVEGDFGEVSEKLQEAAKGELADTRKGVDTVMEILSASNMEKGTVSYKKEPFDFAASVKEELAALAKGAAERGVKLEATLPDDVYEIVGDKQKITDHLVRNLIDNAIKYSPNGTVQVSLTRDGGHVRLSIRDTGVGLTDDDKKTLFTEGGKGKDSLKVNVDSTGYGLYIAKQITDAHGGKIWAESGGRGKGSLFIVELPVEK